MIVWDNQVGDISSNHLYILGTLFAKPRLWVRSAKLTTVRTTTQREREHNKIRGFKKNSAQLVASYSDLPQSWSTLGSPPRVRRSFGYDWLLKK